MPESGCHSFGRPRGRNSASGHKGDALAGPRVAQKRPLLTLCAARAPGPPKKSPTIREPEAILAGLPADVMDELVEDMAEAVVAMLLEPASRPVTRRRR
jgi:hypothetical protein